MPLPRVPASVVSTIGESSMVQELPGVSGAYVILNNANSVRTLFALNYVVISTTHEYEKACQWALYI